MNPLYKLLHLNIGERVIFALHRHWFVFFKKVINFIYWVAVPVIIYAILVNFFPEILARGEQLTLILMGVSLYYLFLWLALFNYWVNFYLDIWVVTNQEIISVDQKGLFNHIVARQSLVRVQDVKAESKGYAATFFHFGNVTIQTAGAKNNFVFQQIPQPYKIADKINDLARKNLKK